MRVFIIMMGLMISIGGFSQENSLAENQNPNYKQSLEHYTKMLKTDEKTDYVALQGTTVQQTYKAIDPMEEKRELKALRRKYRAQRPLWRHQRRMERIKNTRYHDYNYGYDNYYSPWSSSYYSGCSNNFWDTGNLLELSLLGYYIFR